MSKTQFSSSVTAKLGDLKSLKGRYETYEVNVNNSPLSETEKLCAKVDSTMSVIEGLGARLIMSFASVEEIQDLTNSLHSAAKNSRIIMLEQKDQDKNILAAAKTESALKGFALPVVRDGNFEDLEHHDLSHQEIDIAFEATKKALIELADKQISPKEYATKIQEECIKIIQKEHNFGEEKIKSFRGFIAQGVKSKQDKGITTEERTALKSSANEVCQEFKAIFGENKKNIQKAKLVNELIKKFEAKGNTISKETQAKFTELVGNVTRNLGADYTNQSLDKLAGALSKEIDKSKTILSGVRKDLRISLAQLGKISDKITSVFKQEAIEAIKIEGDKKLKELGLKKDDNPKISANNSSPELQATKLPAGVPNVYNEAKKLGGGIPSQHIGQKLIAPPSLTTPKLVRSKSNRTSWDR